MKQLDNLTVAFLSREAIYSILCNMDSCFSPPLSLSVDLEKYSEKLYMHAKIITCKYGEEIVAFLAFYENRELCQFYVPLVCIAEDFQHVGLGSRMFAYLERLAGSDFHSVALEVDKENRKAYNFYLKQGFSIKEDRGGKFLMFKML